MFARLGTPGVSRAVNRRLQKNDKLVSPTYQYLLDWRTDRIDRQDIDRLCEGWKAE
jgi:hypothetical protein